MLALKIILWIFCIMTALIVLKLLTVILALLVRVGIGIDYDGDGLKLKLKYGFLGFKVLPRKEKKPKTKRNRIVAYGQRILEPIAYKGKDIAVRKGKEIYAKNQIQNEIKTAEYLASEKVRLEEEETRLNAELTEAEALVRQTEVAEAIGNPYPDVVDESQLSQLQTIQAKVDTMDLESAYDTARSFAEGFDAESVKALLAFLGAQTSSTLKKVGKRFIVKNFNVGLTVTGKDAADTALKYGEIAAIGYPALEKLGANMTVKKSSLNLTPDFIGRKDKAEFHNKIAFRPLRVLLPFLGYLGKVGLKSFNFVDRGFTISDRQRAKYRKERHDKLINQTADQLAASND